MVSAVAGLEYVVLRERHRREIDEWREDRDDLLATVAHELRGPLSPIRGWASTLIQLGDTIGSEDRRAALETIRRQALRLEQLITSLIEVSKAEHGVARATPSDVGAGEVVRRVIDDFAASSPNRHFGVHADGTLVVRANEVWLEQIIVNLVSNAVKYSPETETVQVDVRRRGDRIEIAVVDHGHGIPSQELPRVFERFHRVDEAAPEGGEGLGLYIARQLAAEMDGHISVESTPGHGSCFVLDLPASAQVIDVRPARSAVGLQAG